MRTEFARDERARGDLGGVYDASDYKLHRALENLPAAAYTCDADGLITYFNRRAVELWGREPKLFDPADRFCGSFKLLTTDGAPIPHDQCWMALAVRDGVEYNGREIVIERPDESRRIALAHATPLFDAHGRVAGAVNVLVDISERKRLEDVVREADRRKSEFLATLSHELRTPLSSIRNAVEVIKLKELREPDVRWCQEVIERQLAHLTRMIDDLVDVGRITRDRFDLRREPIELAKVIRGAVDASRPLIEQGGHELILTLAPEPIHVDADEARLHQVFVNLLDNAARYTPPAGHIWVMALPVDHEVVVSVRDDGVGIRAEDLPNLFEMFYQVEAEHRRAHGFGIGLSLVRKLVEMHGGTVTARSEGQGRGSEFAVRLPRIDAPSLGKKASSQDSPKRSTSGRRILVVDDDHDAAISLARLLRMAGHDTQTAFDGLEAIEVAELFRPEVVLLDIGLPKLDGHETCRRIREQPWGRDMVMVALTGWGRDEDRRKSREAGFAHHLVKPVERDALVKLLAELEGEPADAQPPDLAAH